MEEELLKIMNVFKSGTQILSRDLIELKRQADDLFEANVKLMDKAKRYKNDTYFLCEFIRKNINTDNYMINNLLKKYERKDYEISQVKKETSLY